MLRAVVDSWKENFSGPVTKMRWIGKRWDPLVHNSKSVFLNRERKRFESHMILPSYRLLVVFMTGQMSVNMCKHHISHLSNSVFLSPSFFIWIQNIYQMAFQWLSSSGLQWLDINTATCKLHDYQEHILVKPFW